MTRRFPVDGYCREKVFDMFYQFEHSTCINGRSSCITLVVIFVFRFIDRLELGTKIFF